MKSPSPGGLNCKFCQIFFKNHTESRQTQEKKRKKNFPTHSTRPVFSLLPKPDKDIIRK